MPPKSAQPKEVKPAIRKPPYLPTLKRALGVKGNPPLHELAKAVLAIALSLNLAPGQATVFVLNPSSNDSFPTTSRRITIECEGEGRWRIDYQEMEGSSKIQIGRIGGKENHYEVVLPNKWGVPNCFKVSSPDI